MRRREFLGVVAGGAIAWPLGARAQQSTMPVIGFLSSRSADDSAHLVTALRRGLNEVGYVVGQNVSIEYRWADGHYERLPMLASDMARQRVNVIVATGGDSSALSAKAATAIIPIVFAIGTDPVRLGLAASDNRPGGNATGINILSNTLEAKRLGLLHDLAPQAATIGYLYSPSTPAAERQLRDVQEATSTLALQFRSFAASTEREISAAFESIAQQQIRALVVGASIFFDTRRDQLVDLATRHAVPAIYQFREYAAAGGLISYGINLADAYRQVGNYAGRVLKGESPADLPVLQPTKFNLVINLKTAKALGLTIPSGVLSIADEVIE